MATMAFGRIWWKTRPSKATNLKTEYPNKGGHFLPKAGKATVNTRLSTKGLRSRRPDYKRQGGFYIERRTEPSFCLRDFG